MDLIDRTAIEIRDALANGEASSADLVEETIARTHDAAALNGYVSFDEAGLRQQAQAADARLKAGERLPLLGVPIAIKDNIEVAGQPCGNGTRALDGRIVAADADLIGRLRAAGALITGKVGMHELAFGITSNNAVTGAVRNPWDPARIPGGSSGCSGTVVAARLVPASIGTDTGGSVRVPAALCGVCALRPTVGRVSANGIAPISASRDTAGPLARSVADLALIDSVLTGDASALPEVSLRGLRLGLVRELFWDDLSPGVQHLNNEAVETLTRAGVEFVSVPLHDIDEINGEVSFVVALYEFVRDLTRYLEERQRGVSFEALVRAVASPDVRTITAPLLTDDGRISDVAYQEALEARDSLRGLYRDAFAATGVDALLFPTTPATAAAIGDDDSFIHNGRPSPTFATFIRNTDPGSNAAIPGLSLPLGLADGLPVGLALDGPAGSDRRLLAIGRAIEAVLAPMPLVPLGGR